MRLFNYVVVMALMIISSFSCSHVSGQESGEANWKTLTTVEDVCQAYPDYMQHLLDALNLDYPGLEAVKAAAEKDDRIAALNALLAYYQTSSSGDWLRLEPVQPGDERHEKADAVLRDEITQYTIQAKVPRTKDGRLQWDFRGPDDDREWAWGLNRHHHLNVLFKAYRKTGNPIYLDRLDQDLRDWIISSLPYPDNRVSAHDWRGLETHHRVVCWTDCFYGLMDNPQLRPATRLLMLASLVDHAHYLQTFHAAGGNWITMELSALCRIGIAWPEFKQKTEWIRYSTDTLTRYIHVQVYPDGVQMELTAHYHGVALNNFELLLTLCKQAGIQLPDDYTQCLESMWEYLTWTVRPDGWGLLNNDSDRDHLTPHLVKAAQRYNRPDWEYIATQGKSGQKPQGLPSRIFPWGGHLIMRSGWDADAQWAFFDVGPWGIGHQHNDKLHLSIAAYGRDILVDSGRFSYSGVVAKRFRGYACSAAGHNVILIDGRGQDAGPRDVKSPIPADDYAVEPDFVFARGGFDKFIKLEGAAKHTRAVKYLPGLFWLVVDKITTDRPRDLQALWHFHPDCTVKTQEGDAFSDDPEKGNLRIQPIGPVKWDLEIVKGQEKPNMQGWYSPKYNLFSPAPTAVYSAHIDQNAVFCWLLIPARGSVTPANVETIEMTENTVTLSITHNNKTQQIQIPL